MSKEKSITIIEQKAVEFQEEEVTAVLGEDGIVYVPIRPICETMGVDWSSQRRRIMRDPVLAELMLSVAVMTTDLDPDDRRPRTSHMLALPLEYLNGFLFGISADRVREDIRDKVIQYQKECYKVLYQAFQLDLATAMGQQQVEDSPAIQQLRQIQEMSRAIIQMAEEQIEHEKRISLNEQRLNAAASFVKGIDNRLRAVEQRVSPGNPISDEQAGEIADLVRAIAMGLSEKDDSKNHYQAVWAELRRRFKVSSYKNIPQRQFAAVMGFLQEWDMTRISGSEGGSE